MIKERITTIQSSVSFSGSKSRLKELRTMHGLIKYIKSLLKNFRSVSETVKIFAKIKPPKPIIAIVSNCFATRIYMEKIIMIFLQSEKMVKKDCED